MTTTENTFLEFSGLKISTLYRTAEPDAMVPFGEGADALPEEMQNISERLYAGSAIVEDGRITFAFFEHNLANLY